MTDDFTYDVFLSHSSKDKAIVRDIAERLRKDGVKVWFDEWVLEPGDSIPAKVEEGLERSRVLVLCMSANAFGSDWAQLEAGTFRFRDPLNKERRFIPLRLDQTPIRGTLGQFLYVEWFRSGRKKSYAKLLEGTRASVKNASQQVQIGAQLTCAKSIQLDYKSEIRAYGFNYDGSSAIVGSADATLRYWDLKAKLCMRVLNGHSKSICSVALSSDQRLALSGSDDRSVRLWDLDTGQGLQVLEAHTGKINAVIFDGQGRALSGSEDRTVRLWNLETGKSMSVFKGHTGGVVSIALSADRRLLLTGSEDKTVRVWDVETQQCRSVLEGHTASVLSVLWSADHRRVLSSSDDKTVRLWDLGTGSCLHVLEGHVGAITWISWGADPMRALSASADKTVRLWDLANGECILVLQGHTSSVKRVRWIADQHHAISGDERGGLRLWDLSEFVSTERVLKGTSQTFPHAKPQVQYTNAKVLLIGESGAGKTGLSKVLAGEKWGPSDSTVGAWATQWKLPIASGQGVEREIWLWDFGGQADQRLIHQLYIDETALAVLVFDGQKEDLFDTLGQWDRDLTRAASKDFAKILVAGRVDAGGLRVSRSQIDTFKKDRGFRAFVETSAKTGFGCDDLKKAILDGIRWENIPWRSSPVLFKRLKEEIIHLKDKKERVLFRFNELRDTLHMRLVGENAQFKDIELEAVIGLLAGPGVVSELKFGRLILLHPECINAYAQAVINTMRADEDERGCLPEERVLNGDLKYQSSMARIEGEEERFVLLAMHQMLVERGLCLRQPTERGNLLVFPSYYRKERLDIEQYPAVQVNYRFTGFLDEIYATLVVRLHHTAPFRQTQLWRRAADFKTNIGKQLGIKLTRRSPGEGDLEVYFDAEVSMEEKIIFSKYVHEHLLLHARDVKRLRHYVCPKCGTLVGNREVAMKRLNDWLQGRPQEQRARGFFKILSGKRKPSIICVGCESQVSLWDEMEECFASPEIQQRVRDMQEESAIELSNQSKERALVGEVISTVALAGQICREFTVSDHGIDMEIEFTDDTNKATNKKVYLQLKSGESYMRKRRSDGAEIFTLKKQRHADYWMDSAFPVLLLIRNSEGEVRWMEVRDWLKLESDNGKKPVKQIVFEGERFDVMSVRRWRERVLGG